MGQACVYILAMVAGAVLYTIMYFKRASFLNSQATWLERQYPV